MRHIKLFAIIFAFAGCTSTVSIEEQKAWIHRDMAGKFGMTVESIEEQFGVSWKTNSDPQQPGRVLQDDGSSYGFFYLHGIGVQLYFDKKGKLYRYKWDNYIDQINN
ncbi:MAG TPA: hypothetical protein DGP39_08720 [Verrucomicrobiales bacterium]|nr:hypothetical protein [Verrucomicrobiales bacterium]|tara:strand:- start:4379 stop:4699 length:321 start_codon:yes stop_codon:yes gene_type:complete